MLHDTPIQRPLPVVTDGGEAMSQLLCQFAQSRQPSQPQGVLKRGRPAQVSALLLSVALLWSVLHGWVSQWDLWRRIACFGVAGFAPVPISDQAIYNRLARQGGELMQQCCAQVSQWLWERMQPFEERHLAPFARQVLALDESVLDARKRWLPELRGTQSKDACLLAGRLACLFDVRRQQWVRIDWLPDALANCQVHAQQMLQGIAAGTLLLFDLGYYKFEWFDQLTQRGVWWVSRLRSNGSLSMEHVLCQRDGYLEALVFVGAYRSDRCAYLVRLIRLRHEGIWYSYLTNVLDPARLSGAHVVQLYARRWDIELGFALLKEHLGLRWLWSAKPQVIAAQLWATVTLAQLLHALQVQVAAQANVPTFDVSLELLWRYLPELASIAQHHSRGLLQTCVERGRSLGIIRASSRTQWQVPQVSWHEMHPPPVDLVWIRTPRYAHKPAGSRPKGRAHQRRKPFS